MEEVKMKRIVSMIVVVLSLVFTVSSRAQEPTVNVHFERKKQAYGLLVGWMLDCDGVVLGSIHEGKRHAIDTQMTVGTHTCQINTSNLVRINVYPGGSIVEISFDQHGLNSYFAFRSER
jgi:hypothetical protein